jgi:hypothetical protein
MVAQSALTMLLSATEPPEEKIKCLRNGTASLGKAAAVAAVAAGRSGKFDYD